MEYLLPYLCMVTVPHIMVGLERMLDYRGVRLARFYCTSKTAYSTVQQHTHSTVCTSTVNLTILYYEVAYIKIDTIHTYLLYGQYKSPLIV